MGAYLIDNPPARSQFSSRSRRPTGLTVLHTAESVLDTVGPDTGAEGVASFIRGRSDPGSYHDLCDSDSVVHLVPYDRAAYQDGTGSNPYALSISWALRTTDWVKLTPQRRRAFLTRGAEAFARQQRWLAANGYPRTPLRWVSKAQSDAGAAGFIRHADRDPARRSDPGAQFPGQEFMELCAAAVAGTLDEGEQDLDADQNNRLTEAWQDARAAKEYAGNAAGIASEVRNWILDPNHGVLRQLAALGERLDGLAPGATVQGQPVDLDALAEKVADKLATRLAN